MQPPSPLRTPLLLQLTPQLGLQAPPRTCRPLLPSLGETPHTCTHMRTCTYSHACTHMHITFHIHSLRYTHETSTCTPIHVHNNHIHTLALCAFSIRTLHKGTHIHSQSLYMYVCVLKYSPMHIYVAGAHPRTFTVRTQVFSHAHTVYPHMCTPCPCSVHTLPSNVRSRVHSTTTCSYNTFHTHVHTRLHVNPQLSRTW